MQVQEFNSELLSAKKYTNFAQGTYNNFWGTGLNTDETTHTYYDKWPGDNNLGVLMKKVSNKTKTTMKQKPKEVTPHPSKIKQQRNIESMLKGAADETP